MRKWIEDLWNRIFGNHLVQSGLSYFSFRLLETNQANQYLANVMLWFAVSAFVLWFLEKAFGVKTPLIKVGILFKVFRNLIKFQNPDTFVETYDIAYAEGKKIVKGMKRMKQFGKWLYANKMTIIGLISSVLLFVELHWNVSAELGIDREWYITLSAILLGVVEIAVSGRGMESVEKFFNIKENKKKIKEDKEVQKKLKQAEEWKAILGLAENKPTPPPTEQPVHPNQNANIRQRL